MYNFLFYKGYQGAENSGNWGDWYALAGCSTVAFCLLLNLLSLSLVLERVLDWDAKIWIKPEYKWAYVAGVVAITLSYYFIGSRYKRIVDRYENRPTLKNIPPIVVILAYNIISLFLMILAGVFKNHGWIFN